MKLAFTLFIRAGAALWCTRELVLGFRRGSMSTLAHFSVPASRTEKPGMFWFNVALNLFVAAAMAFTAITQL
jgi:hypothetical protein